MANLFLFFVSYTLTHTILFLLFFGSAAQAWSRSDYIFPCSACCQGSNTESVLTCDLVIWEYVITIVRFTAHRGIIKNWALMIIKL